MRFSYGKIENLNNLYQYIKRAELGSKELRSLAGWQFLANVTKYLQIFDIEAHQIFDVYQIFANI